jgi:hypothetical protein
MIAPSELAQHRGFISSFARVKLRSSRRGFASRRISRTDAPVPIQIECHWRDVVGEINRPATPIAALHKPSLATVFDYSCALAQGDWCPRPPLTCGQVCCHCKLKVLDAGQVRYDVLAVGIPRIDAISEMGAIVYRHFSLAPVLFGFPTSERKEATRRASGLFLAAAIFASPAYHKYPAI